MNKVKMFFIAAALVLTTAGVFAGKAKFAATAIPNLYYLNGTYQQISPSIASASILVYYPGGVGQTGTPATLSFLGNGPYNLYSFDVSNSAYYPVY
jgi:hypothetical protein